MILVVGEKRGCLALNLMGILEGLVTCLCATMEGERKAAFGFKGRFCCCWVCGGGF